VVIAIAILAALCAQRCARLYGSKSSLF
jgi:hypothetical protein